MDSMTQMDGPIHFGLDVARRTRPGPPGAPPRHPGKLASGAAGQRWQEIASETLHEQFSLRQAAVSGAYRDLFDEAVERIVEHEQQVSGRDGRDRPRRDGDI